ncbi:MAG: GDYXXLXY domain-containing protein [Cyclobacteriaceae bacterium]|nr:GDYXXLXY domain-containing protein [Cyclobacteriaceae bacterium]
MRNINKIVIGLNLVLLLGYLNYSIFIKERQLHDGRLVLLRLAPVDPRSLMQGDYMELRYDLSSLEWDETLPKKGYCILKKDTLNVANILRVQLTPEPLNEGEFLLKFTAGKRGINLGAESYFFEEGTAEIYENARYGGLILDKEGNSLLYGLFNENYVLLHNNIKN